MRISTAVQALGLLAIVVGLGIFAWPLGLAAVGAVAVLAGLGLERGGR